MTHIEIRDRIVEFSADLASVSRRWPLEHSPARRERASRLLDAWSDRLGTLDETVLGPIERLDLALLEHSLRTRRRKLEVEAAFARQIDAALPFASEIVLLEEDRLAMTTIEPELAASKLDGIAASAESLLETTFEPALRGRAQKVLVELRDAFGRWFEHYDGYDPQFSWWNRAPFARAKSALERLGERLSTEEGEIPGTPVGREALEADLAAEGIPYSMERLVEIGEREYEWCLVRMRQAASEMGFGEDWRAALEAVKDLCLPPGEQPKRVRELALEAIEFVESRDLLSIPQLAKETWRLDMMSPERQKVAPFFLGGETILVSYPTDAMSHSEKRMSMRGNNPYFSRATVQHELFPGHAMQMYMTERHRPYRKLFGTPFWVEGWTLYWELLLWEIGFPRSPQERIGMLFWRMHRCVRVMFSLRFHLGQLSTAECAEMLVERVGHERSTAEGEVRRSFNGDYPPLYQIAYLIGGLQFMALRREFVAGRGWSDRTFHDAILLQNQMPPTYLRFALAGEAPPRYETPTWHFDEPSLQSDPSVG